MKASVWTLVAVTPVVLGVASSASAQATGTPTSPTFEWSAAYQFQHVGAWWLLPDRGEKTFPNFPAGLAMDGARYWGRFGLVVEGGWGRGRIRESFFSSYRNSFYHVGAGPRVALATAGRVRPYTQVLMGGSFLTGPGSTRAGFMLQPGVGATFIMGGRWGLFSDVAYRRTFFSVTGRDGAFTRGSNEIRVLAGVRMIHD